MLTDDEAAAVAVVLYGKPVRSGEQRETSAKARKKLKSDSSMHVSVCQHTATSTLASTGVETRLDLTETLDKGKIAIGHYIGKLLSFYWLASSGEIA